MLRHTVNSTYVYVFNFSLLSGIRRVFVDTEKKKSIKYCLQDFWKLSCFRILLLRFSVTCQIHKSVASWNDTFELNRCILSFVARTSLDRFNWYICNMFTYLTVVFGLCVCEHLWQHGLYKASAMIYLILLLKQTVDI